MGIIRAIKQTVGGTLADQWLEVIEPVGKIPSPTDR